MTFLAQDIPTGAIMLRIGGVIVALIVLGVAVLSVRRRLLGGGPADSGAALDMETLQRQHREGAISEEEFRTLRRALLGLASEDVPAKPDRDASGA